MAPTTSARKLVLRAPRFSDGDPSTWAAFLGEPGAFPSEAEEKAVLQQLGKIMFKQASTNPRLQSCIDFNVPRASVDFEKDIHSIDGLEALPSGYRMIKTPGALQGSMPLIYGHRFRVPFRDLGSFAEHLQWLYRSMTPHAPCLCRICTLKQTANPEKAEVQTAKAHIPTLLIKPDPDRTHSLRHEETAPGAAGPSQVPKSTKDAAASSAPPHRRVISDSLSQPDRIAASYSDPGGPVPSSTEPAAAPPTPRQPKTPQISAEISVEPEENAAPNDSNIVSAPTGITALQRAGLSVTSASSESPSARISSRSPPEPSPAPKPMPQWRDEAALPQPGSSSHGGATASNIAGSSTGADDSGPALDTSDRDQFQTAATRTSIDMIDAAPANKLLDAIGQLTSLTEGGTLTRASLDPVLSLESFALLAEQYRTVAAQLESFVKLTAKTSTDTSDSTAPASATSHSSAPHPAPVLDSASAASSAPATSHVLYQDSNSASSSVATAATKPDDIPFPQPNQEQQTANQVEGLTAAKLQPAYPQGARHHNPENVLSDSATSLSRQGFHTRTSARGTESPAGIRPSASMEARHYQTLSALEQQQQIQQAQQAQLAKQMQEMKQAEQRQIQQVQQMQEMWKRAQQQQQQQQQQKLQLQLQQQQKTPPISTTPQLYQPRPTSVPLTSPLANISATAKGDAMSPLHSQQTWIQTIGRPYQHPDPREAAYVASASANPSVSGPMPQVPAANQDPNMESAKTLIAQTFQILGSAHSVETKRMLLQHILSNTATPIIAMTLAAIQSAGARISPENKQILNAALQGFKPGSALLQPKNPPMPQGIIPKYEFPPPSGPLWISDPTSRTAIPSAFPVATNPLLGPHVPLGTPARPRPDMVPNQPPQYVPPFTGQIGRSGLVLQPQPLADLQHTPVPMAARMTQGRLPLPPGSQHVPTPGTSAAVAIGSAQLVSPSISGALNPNAAEHATVVHPTANPTPARGTTSVSVVHPSLRGQRSTSVPVAEQSAPTTTPSKKETGPQGTSSTAKRKWPSLATHSDKKAKTISPTGDRPTPSLFRKMDVVCIPVYLKLLEQAPIIRPGMSAPWDPASLENQRLYWPAQVRQIHGQRSAKVWTTPLIVQQAPDVPSSSTGLQKQRVHVQIHTPQVFLSIDQSDMYVYELSLFECESIAIRLPELCLLPYLEVYPHSVVIPGFMNSEFIQRPGKIDPVLLMYFKAHHVCYQRLSASLIMYSRLQLPLPLAGVTGATPSVMAELDCYRALVLGPVTLWTTDRIWVAEQGSVLLKKIVMFCFHRTTKMTKVLCVSLDPEGGRAGSDPEGDRSLDRTAALIDISQVVGRVYEKWPYQKKHLALGRMISPGTLARFQ